MRIDSFANMPKLLLASCLAIVSACGTSESEANAVSVSTGRQNGAAPATPSAAVTPSASKRDHRLSLPGGAAVPGKVDESKVPRTTRVSSSCSPGMAA